MTNLVPMMDKVLKAEEKARPLKIRYTKEDGQRSTRIIEIYDVTVSKNGHFLAIAMDRHSGERRSFRIDRMESGSIQRGRYRLARR